VLDIKRDTYYQWVASDPEFVKEMEEAEEKAIDQLIEECETTHRVLRKGIPRIKEKEVNGETVLYQDGWEVSPDRAALEFYLRTKGRRKGYGENIDVTTKGEKVTMTEEEIRAKMERIDKILKGSQ